MVFESNALSLAKVMDGKDGAGKYIHIMYSDIENPEYPGDMSTIPLDYMGVCVNESATPPQDPKEYTWAKIKGDTGKNGATGRPGSPGQDGSTYYIHIKWSNDGGETFSGESGAWMGGYTDTSPDALEIPILYQWTRVAGTDGTIISISNDSHTVPTDEHGLNGNYTGAETLVSVLQGTADATDAWNITYAESEGVTGTFAESKYGRSKGRLCSPGKRRIRL